MSDNKNLISIFIILIVLMYSCSEKPAAKGIPPSSRQLVLVLTDSVTSTKGFLYYFEREDNFFNWKRLNSKFPVVIGRNGLGLGRGLHHPSVIQDFPVKKEGDGRSPAGIFNLSAVFGYKSPGQMTGLNMPYIHITELSECIDDANSKYYNQIVSGDSMQQSGLTDWQSSEKMSQAGIYYELGVVVDHNVDPVRPGSGSCIFLHNWADPNETMAGCTGMAPENMNEIAWWLDIEKNPVLIQLTKPLYFDLSDTWALPEFGALSY